MTILLQECLKDRNVWLFAITYFFVYVVRQARSRLYGGSCCVLAAHTAHSDV